MTGLAAFSAGVFICGACGSYSPTDPSLNTASDVAPANLFGASGAQAADLLMQGFGWTAWLGGFALMAGGLRRTLGIGQRDPSRWMYGAFALVVSAACLAEWPIPSSWPLATGLGGMAGNALLSLFATPFAALHAPQPETWAAATAGVGGVILAALSMGLGSQDGAALLRTLHRTGAASADVSAQLAGATGRSLPGLLGRLGGLIPRPRADRKVKTIVYSEDDGFDAPEQAFFHKVNSAEAARALPVVRPDAPRLEADNDAAQERPEIRRPEPAIRPEAQPAPRAEARQDMRPDIRVDTAARAATASAPPVPRPAPPATPASRAQAQPSAPSPTIVRDAASELPPIELLDVPPPRQSAVDEARLLEMAERLQVVFNDFGVKGRIVEVRPGPVVTLFELEPAPGVKSSRVINLAEDIARSMSATAARVAVIPGRNAIGIELPNPTRETVYLRDLLNAQEFRRGRAALPLALGENIEGQPTIADLGKMPHLLIAGTTGSGKSVGINAMILSLMFKLPPEKCRFIMVDPKMLELSIYEGVPHLLAPVVTDPQKAVIALKWVVREMESRYELMSKMSVRNIAGFNQKAEEAAARGDYLTKPIQTGWNKETGEPVWETEHIKPEPMPHIVVVIDEMADLMLVAGKDIEAAVQRIAQMARAAGIHLIMATQRPSVDVITGTIKANFPTRISYMVTSKIDSRTILGEQGAEQLLGMGDLLWMASGGKIVRVHGPFVKDEEVERVVNWLKERGAPQYVAGVTEEVEEEPSVADNAFGASSGDPDEDLYREAVAIVLRDKRPTTSYVQRMLRIGYNRAALLIERMEQDGIVTAANTSGKREIVGRGHGEEAA